MKVLPIHYLFFILQVWNYFFIFLCYKGCLLHNIWSQNTILNWLLQNESSYYFPSILLLGNLQDMPNFKVHMRYNGVPRVKFLGSDLLCFKSYGWWKLKFLTSPKTSLKNVFLAKQLFLKLMISKLSSTSVIENMDYLAVPYPNFKHGNKVFVMC